MLTLGTTLFSLTPDWRAGEGATAILQRVAEAGCGPALEVIGHQAWRGFPAVSADDERAFRDAVDRWGLRPVALGDLPAAVPPARARPMSTDGVIEDSSHSWRPLVGWASRWSARTSACRRSCCVACPRRRTGSASSSPSRCRARPRRTLLPSSTSWNCTPRPAARTSAYHGLQRHVADAARRARHGAPPAGSRGRRRRGRPPDLGAGRADRPPASGQRWRWSGASGGAAAHRPRRGSARALRPIGSRRTGRDVLPLVRHAHAKFWDPDVESVRGAARRLARRPGRRRL